jgi:hypothetical protein
MHGIGAPNCKILRKISFFSLTFRIMDVAAPKAKQPPAYGLQKQNKRLKRKPQPPESYLYIYGRPLCAPDISVRLVGVGGQKA